MSEIDRAILSTLKTKDVVDTVVARLPDVVPCDEVSVTVMDTYIPGKARTYVGNTSSESEDEYEIQPVELEQLRHNPSGSVLERANFPNYLEPLAKRGTVSALVIPTYSKDSLSAIIALGNLQHRDYSEEDLAQARQMAARAAVGLSNAQLIEDLDQHNWETLVTLARAIDASSPWTLGHSERGADLAVSIGRQMGLSEDQLVHLHRGALLHDIGKLAIDRSVLDKQGVLTEEERRIMREHPRKGARILSAHRSYAKAIPVVEQHHECWDGSGYPDGLAGEDIDILGRIYAVADVFDALITDRPYRAGLSRAKVVDYITGRSGIQFDPAVVQALLRVLEREKEDPNKKSLRGSPLLTT
jgi:putative nucleotidyltransferase with HDIG domain